MYFSVLRALFIALRGGPFLCPLCMPLIQCMYIRNTHIVLTFIHEDGGRLDHYTYTHFTQDKLSRRLIYASLVIPLCASLCLCFNFIRHISCQQYIYILSYFKQGHRYNLSFSVYLLKIIVKNHSFSSD